MYSKIACFVYLFQTQSVNVDAKDKGGYTAVMLAAVNKHEKVMKFEIISAIYIGSSCLKRGVGSAMPQFFKRWIALSSR